METHDLLEYMTLHAVEFKYKRLPRKLLGDEIYLCVYVFVFLFFFNETFFTSPFAYLKEKKKISMRFRMSTLGNLSSDDA